MSSASSRLVVRIRMLMLTEWKLAAGMRMKAWDAGSVTVRSCCTAAGDTRWQLSSCNINKKRNGIQIELLRKVKISPINHFPDLQKNRSTPATESFTFLETNYFLPPIIFHAPQWEIYRLK